MLFPFQNTYAGLPDRFFAKQAPIPVRGPTLIAVNRALATMLNIDLGDDEDQLAGVFAGNIVPDGSEPLAMAYAGHQFGGWSPQLGDGRALLLGEVTASNGKQYDIQLKGSGRTPWSRGGDGRAWLGPVLREYVVSEAMAALGVPSTRALAATLTGEDVIREEALPGAVVTRVASSHIRVGTFQYFAAREDIEALETLMNFAIDRHYPKAASAENPALSFLEHVIAAQAELIAAWMGVGFIHGVMNTDNCAVSGETIDYGPCAFMDEYHPDTVYSSIDRQGRYAYSNQPRLAHWNLAQLASSVLPLIDADTDRAIEKATAAVDQFVALYQDAWSRVFARKIGLDDSGLAQALLSAMDVDGMDFTNTFRALSGLVKAGDFGDDAPNCNLWLKRWRAVSGDVEPEALDHANPALIPRNHQIEKMITLARSGDFTHFEALMDALSRPFEMPADLSLTRPPALDEVVKATFCGT